MPIFSNADTRRILLIGDIKTAFSDADALSRAGASTELSRMSCEIRTIMPDAIDAAAKRHFRAVGVVMSGLSARLSSALRSLREVNPDTKIILLAQMYEEPTAMQLVGPARNGKGAADDYLICPTRINRFYESIEPAQAAEITEPVTIDATTQIKIKQLEKLATEDDLTGLRNRRYIWEFSRQIIEHAGSENGRVTLLVFDIDNFKHYNDLYGHSAGDEILRQAAVLMRRCCRGHDVVGRIGGDEFAVVFWDRQKSEVRSQKTEVRSQKSENRRQTLAEHPKEPIFIAMRFRKELERTELDLLGPEGKGVLTISGGLASFPRNGSTIQQLFGQADRALLEAKRSGKNRIYLVGKPKSDIADVE